MTPAVHKQRKKKRAFLPYLVRLCRAAARLIPFRVASFLGGLLGGTVFLLLRRERERAFESLTTAFPDKDRAWVRGTARRTFIHLGRSLFEAFAIRPRQISRYVHAAGFDRIRRALETGRGAVYVAAHIGNWELMAGAVGRVFPLSVIAAPLKPEPMNDLIVTLRAELGVRTILRGRPGAAKEMIRIFRENGVLGILIDQDTDVEGAFVDFFGKQAWTPTGAVQIALRFNAPVFFGYIHRGRHGIHQVTVEGPFELSRSGSEENDLAENTAMLTARIEQTIRKDPVQWVWMHRRWRRRP